ncbi:MAG: hypothetical protein J3Q66DRAFT_333755 [Benniella sp.]|nr:MAG: hypothetical protein J3Q66DRAFT_333755 [Benniella sp.]
MSRQPLPLECVLIILGFLSEERDTDTMTRLLCINRTICALTLPFLYGDCFNFNMHNNRPRSKKSAFTTVSQLIRTLLRQVHPQYLIPDVLKIAYLSQDNQGDPQPTAYQPTPLFRYGRFIRKMAPSRDLRNHLIDAHPNSPAMKYGADHHLYDRYVADGLIFHCHGDDKNRARADALEMDVYRKLVWTLCQGCMDSIEELSIPMGDIERYIDHLSQFRSLFQVNFVIEKKLKKVGFPDCMHTYVSPEDYGQRYNGMGPNHDRHFGDMAHFVLRHTVVHPHTLRQASLPSSLIFPETSRSSIKIAWFKIMSFLPPLHNPRQIRSSDTCKLAARLKDTDLSHVESMTLTHQWETISAEKEMALNHLKYNKVPFLSRCRSLKHLEMETLGPDMFHWAVLEKKQLDARRQQESIVGQQSSSGQHAHHSNLVPLQSVELFHGMSLKPGQELDDIASAFSDSLEKLTVRGRRDGGRPVSVDLGTVPVAMHGYGWTLPRLRILDFRMPHSQLQFDLDALQRFHALESLRLEDCVNIYRHRDIRPWPSINLPHLKKLYLQGSPALCFNLNSLHYSPRLECLALSMPFTRTFDHYMPSPEEMRDDSVTQGSQDTAIDDHGLSGTPSVSQGYQSIGRRPRFIWDWHLPNLRELDMRAVFAYKFEFQWLQHLPNLLHICLGMMVPPDGIHKRDITLGGLSRKPRQQQDEEGQILSDRYFSFPKLEVFSVLGHWNITTEVLEVFCLFVAPNLRRIHFGHSCVVGIQLREWITLARKMPRLEQSHLNQEFAADEIQKLGLLDHLQDDHRNKRHLKHSFRGGVYWDVLDP